MQLLDWLTSEFTVQPPGTGFLIIAATTATIGIAIAVTITFLYNSPQSPSPSPSPSSNTESLILSNLNTINGEIPQLEKKFKTKIKVVQILRNSNIKSIPDRAFEGCSSLESVHFEDGGNVTTIGGASFCDCTSLQSIHVPKGVTTIGEYCFYDCTSLQSICIPDGATIIGWAAFCRCTSLQSFHIPNGVTTIKGSVFRDCKSLQSINIPNTVRTIEGYAFRNCLSLKSIYIPDGVTSIGTNAFHGCKSLHLVHIPNTVTTIGIGAFERCDTLNQRRTNAGLNNDPHIATWLRQRFDYLPIHRACHDLNNNAQSRSQSQFASAVDRLSTLVRDNEPAALAATDAMGMTPLHILCCNPRATAEMVRVIVEGDPSLVTQMDITGSTPLQLFLKCRNFIKADDDDDQDDDYEKGEMPPTIYDLLKRGIKSDDLNIMLVLNKNKGIDLNFNLSLSRRDESTGLLPYMSAATLSQCGLDVVFILAMENLDIIIQALNNK